MDPDKGNSRSLESINIINGYLHGIQFNITRSILALEK